MNLLEIVMLILGILVIILSCRVAAYPDKKSKGSSLEDSDIKDIYMQEELNTFKEQHNEILALASEDAIAKTDDYLSKLSNEKIMAVSEYSDQILEKINKNHEEVVFLYNMLNNKEKELKDTLITIDRSQAQSIKSQPIGKSAKEPTETKQADISISNTEILKLYKKGNSILNIAKQMGIGQGEVKLIIDLYSGR